MKYVLAIFFTVNLSLLFGQNPSDSLAFVKFKLLKMTLGSKPSALPNYYLPTLGFFCKKELLVQQKTGFPVKLRLGTVQTTDKQEGK